MVFTLSFSPCSGLGCSVRYCIVYDLQKKTSDFFGTFRTGFEFTLYDFNIDKTINFISKTYHGRNSGQMDFTKYELFSLNKEGYFQLKQNAKTELFILNTYPEYEHEEGRITVNWFEKIK